MKIIIVFKAILQLAYFPLLSKTHISMINKPEKEHTRVESYGSINMLSNMWKLYEKIIITKLNPILSKKGYIPHHEFGFRRHYSTIEQTHGLVTTIKKAFEERKYCSMLLIDVS